MVESGPLTQYDRKSAGKSIKICIRQTMVNIYIEFTMFSLCNCSGGSIICCLMYRQSKMFGQLDYVRPDIRLGSNARVKFKNTLKRNY